MHEATCERFGLFDGQFYVYQEHENLQWFLNGERFGFGDLTSEQVHTIQESLNEGEVFEGFNEHHGTEFQQTDHAIICITHDEIHYPSRERRGF
jgi:hypothetical protein